MPDSNMRPASQILAGAPNPYDLVPYESYPFAKSHIRHLHAMGRLFGLSPAGADGCRVLELGGASGGNLIPMAIDHPGSRFTGIDLSARQIEAGRRQVADLGLKNIELRTASIMDVDGSYGAFDYIIAHGVFSWVPAAVQDMVLTICRDRLAPDGIAVVDYNTLPGWAPWQGLRETILQHGRRIEDPMERLRHARQLLNAMRESAGQDQTPHGQTLCREIDRMLELSDWFLLHDHLEEDNTPIYFHQFVERARASGLAYLGEADLSAMHVRGLAAQSDSLGMAEDIIRQQQYLDLVQNRRFRLSLLGRPGARPDHAIAAERLWDFRWRAALRPQAKPEDLATAISGPLAFLDAAGNQRLRTSDRLSGAAFATLCRHDLPVLPADIVQEAMSRFAIADEAGLKAALLAPARDLAMTNAIELHTLAGNWVPEISERPLASRLARYQARHSTWLTSQRHEPVGADPAVREVIRHVDGRHSRMAILEEMRKLAERGKLNLQHEGRQVMDRVALARLLPALVDEVLTFLARNSLLIG
jgi:methyltransferase-like protein